MTSRFLLGGLVSSLLSSAIACGGAQTTAESPGGPAGGPNDGKPAAAGDVTFDVGPIEVKGLVFAPEALGRPGTPLVEPKKKTTIEKQRQTFASQKDPVQKQAHAAILATLLYQKSKEDKANEKALWTEARQALRDAAATAKDKPDEITLRLLGSYELLLEDYPAAEKAWAGLVTLDPKNKETPGNRAWWAYSLLQQGKNAEALEVVKAETPSEKQPELAYAMAWAKWRTGDQQGAWQALVTASKGWGTSPNREVIDRDLILFASRNPSLTPDQAAQALFAATNAKQPAAQYSTLVALGLQAYQFAGRWSDAIATIDKAIATAGATVPVNDLPVLRYHQADFNVRLDNPEASAKYGKLALEAMPACGAKCPENEKQDMIYGLYVGGRLFHGIYATANDVRYYQPAKDLYTATVAVLMDPTRRGEAQRDLQNLDATLKNTKAGRGTHDKGVLGPLLRRHDQEVQACYEAGLVGDPKLSGNLTVELESDQTGVIKGVATEPKAGAADMSAVAGCVAEQAKTWKLPTRGVAGTTRVKLAYTMSPKTK
ncbi:MAG: AgmX/PglI C-terminal domain-containing protein [Kofleriaceae bacterium]|nr:AgmX/PglI C-terminal domain-containing protein [Kofleriaceae bacterium]